MSAWLFGKLPAHGDFVARGVSAADRDALDGWLSRQIDAGSHIPTFARCHDAAPPWRFAWRHDDGWTAGAMAASIDAAGRRFPVLIARDTVAGDAVPAMTVALEQLLYDALAGSLDADEVQARAAAIVPGGAGPAPAGDGWWTVGGDGFSERFLPGARPAGLIAAMLAADREELDER